jgi:hypothetical protein
MLALDGLGAPRLPGGQHHERLDGSGYPHGLGDGSPWGRIRRRRRASARLSHDRRHGQPTRRPTARDRCMQGSSTPTRSTRCCVAGHRRSAHPRGSRRDEVLRLLARGLSNKEIATTCDHAGRAMHTSTSTPRSAPNRAQGAWRPLKHGLMTDADPSEYANTDDDTLQILPSLVTVAPQGDERWNGTHRRARRYWRRPEVST